jgi:hypothetical protein
VQSIFRLLSNYKKLKYFFSYDKGTIMDVLFQELYAAETQIHCIYCKKTSPYWGWTDLCNRTCYYGLSDLLEAYESGSVAEPDPRIVTYFTKNPEPAHSFIFNKLAAYIKNNS